MPMKDKHPHYHKDVAHLTHIDVYRVLERFNVTSPTLQHAIKKLLVAGGRGAGKDQNQDVQEAIDSLQRFQEMRLEDSREASDSEIIAGANEAFRRVLSQIPKPNTPVEIRKNAKKMSEDTKRQLTTRKAAKAAPRRGR